MGKVRKGGREKRGRDGSARLGLGSKSREKFIFIFRRLIEIVLCASVLMSLRLSVKRRREERTA